MAFPKKNNFILILFCCACVFAKESLNLNNTLLSKSNFTDKAIKNNISAPIAVTLNQNNASKVESIAIKSTSILPEIQSTKTMTQSNKTKSFSPIYSEGALIIQDNENHKKQIYRRPGAPSTIAPIIIKKPILTIPSEQILLKLSQQLVNQTSTDSISNILNETTSSSVTTSMTNNLTVQQDRPNNAISTSTHFSAEEPKIQYSKELILESSTSDGSRNRYFLPIILPIFAVPMVLAVCTIAFRRFKNFWYTRHYRRMDFLIDEMYID